MNEMQKEKLRILNLVDAINERGAAVLSLDVSPIGYPLSVIRWEKSGMTDSGFEIIHDWRISGGNELAQMQKLRHDLGQILARAKAKKVAA